MYIVKCLLYDHSIRLSHIAANFGQISKNDALYTCINNCVSKSHWTHYIVHCFRSRGITIGYINTGGYSNMPYCYMCWNKYIGLGIMQIDSGLACLHVCLT